MSTILCLLALLSGLAVEPSLADAVSSATLSASRETTDTLACWRYPALRGSFRRYAEWSRGFREDPGSTATLALVQRAVDAGSPADRAAGLLALQDHFTTSVLSREELAAERKAAGAILLRPRPWGGEGLLVPLAYPGNTAGPGGLIGFLAEQLGEDDVPHNAFSAAELLYTGLKADRERFLPPLLMELDAQRRESGSVQAAVILANILFTCVLADPKEFATTRESWAGSSYDSLLAFDRRIAASLPGEERRMLMGAAVWASSRRIVWTTPYEVDEYARFNRWMAWTLLEKAEPFPEEELRAVIESPQQEHREKRRALALFFLREPLALVDGRNRDLFAETVASWDGYWGWRARQLGAVLADDEMAWGDLFEDLHGSWPDYSAVHPRESLPRIAPVLKASLAEMLEREHVQSRQMNLADAIMGAKHREGYDLAAVASVSNLANDEVSDNAARARSILEDLGAEAVVAAHAGLQVGAEVGDWQLIAFAAGILSSYDDDFDAAQYPKAMEVMAQQLGNDEIEGNATAARSFLWQCSLADRKRILEPLLESSDEQERESAQAMTKW